MIRVQQLDTLVGGLIGPSSLRCRDGAIWVSDRFDHRVIRLALDTGESSTATYLAGDRPGGLGFLGDELLVVAESSRLVLRLLADGALVRHGDLSKQAQGDLRDLVVDDAGTAFVSDLGRRALGRGSSRGGGRILRVDPDGRPELAAEELEAPNGLALGHGRLYVAEGAAGRITTFAIGPGGVLSDRQTFAEIPAGALAHATMPDGICLDGVGGLWCADPLGMRVVRVEAGGEVTHEIQVGSGLAPSTCGLLTPDVLVIGAGEGFGPAGRRTGCVLAAALVPAAAPITLAS